MQIHFKFAYFSFFPYSFGIEMINTLIHSIPNSRPKWAKCIPVSDQHGAKTLSDRGGTYLYGLYKGIPHHPLPPTPPTPPASNTVQSRLKFIFVTINPQFTFNYLTSHNQRQWEKRTGVPGFFH